MINCTICSVMDVYKIVKVLVILLLIVMLENMKMLMSIYVGIALESSKLEDLKKLRK